MMYYASPMIDLRLSNIQLLYLVLYLASADNEREGKRAGSGGSLEQKNSKF